MLQLLPMLFNTTSALLIADYVVESSCHQIGLSHNEPYKVGRVGLFKYESHISQNKVFTSVSDTQYTIYPYL
jgi:hypothetical protein